MSTSAARTERHPYHHGNLEVALVEQARAMVAEFGTEEVSLRAVAGKVGVSPSAVYHHFPDKNSLLAAIGQQVIKELAAEQTAAMNAIPGKSATAVRKRFRASGEAYVNYAIANPNLFRLCFGPLCVADHEKDRTETNAWQMLIENLDELVACGELDPKLRPNVEFHVWATVHGSATLVLDGLLPPEAIQLVLDSLEAMLRIGKSAKGGKLKEVAR
jgi:AcrR family transcriptional regulator